MCVSENSASTRDNIHKHIPTTEADPNNNTKGNVVVLGKRRFAEITLSESDKFSVAVFMIASS